MSYISTILSYIPGDQIVKHSAEEQTDCSEGSYVGGRNERSRCISLNLLFSISYFTLCFMNREIIVFFSCLIILIFFMGFRDKC